jgi:hypothetical protein
MADITRAVGPYSAAMALQRLRLAAILPVLDGSGTSARAGNSVGNPAGFGFLCRDRAQPGRHVTSGGKDRRNPEYWGCRIFPLDSTWGACLQGNAIFQAGPGHYSPHLECQICSMRSIVGTASLLASPVPLENQHRSPATSNHSTRTIPFRVATVARAGRSRRSKRML